MADKSEGVEKGEYVIGIAVILAALLVSVTVYLSVGDLNKAFAGLKVAQISDAAANAASSQNGTQQAAQSEVKMIVISDKRCSGCDAAAQQVASQLKTLITGLKVTQYDYSSSEGKAAYLDAGGSGYLPMFLFDDAVKSTSAYSDLESYLAKAGRYQTLYIGSSFDPTAEICGNGIDDDGSGKADCADPACGKDISCMEKLDKPKVELFVMSYCPYGTQMEKGMLPVVDLLGSNVDWNVRFVNYAMHGEKEVRENQLEYCIQKQNKAKYYEYLRCFLNSSNSEACLALTNLTRTQFQACYDDADKQFNITANYNNTATWLSGQYPLFSIDADLNKKYDVGGSPTFVINGVVNENMARDPASILAAVCSGFKKRPAECNQSLSSQAYAAGFGFEYQAIGAIASGSCG